MGIIISRSSSHALQAKRDIRLTELTRINNEMHRMHGHGHTQISLPTLGNLAYGLYEHVSYVGFLDAGSTRFLLASQPGFCWHHSQVFAGIIARFLLAS